MKKNKDKLRYGFTTGTSATVAATGAYIYLKKIILKKDIAKTLSLPITEKLEVKLPENKKLTINYSIIKIDNNSVTAEVIKDAGDDPDITNNIKIRAKVEFIQKEDIKEEDYIIPLKDSTLIISSHGGIGVVRKKGLDATLGKWAINIVPRKMIIDNLMDYGIDKPKDETLRVSLQAVNGTIIAKKTLNKMLGVTGGISILGTSGIVVPYSNSAYIKTIEILIRSQASEGKDELALVTGNRTKKALLQDCKSLQESDIIRIADFIGASLERISQYNFKKVHIACMPGKLYKYACGIHYTHAHKTALDMTLMIEKLKKYTLPEKTLINIKNSKTVSEIFSFLKPSIINTILVYFTEKALINLQKWSGSKNIILYVYNSEGKLLCQSSRAH